MFSTVRIGQDKDLNGEILRSAPSGSKVFEDLTVF